MVRLEMDLKMQPVKEGFCVPNTVWSVLRYFDRPTPWTHIADGLDSCAMGGTELENVEPFLRRHGLGLRKLKLTYSSIREVLENGNPVLVCYDTGYNGGHFSTVVGVKRLRRRITVVTLNDTYYGPMDLPLDLLKILIKCDEDQWAREVYEL